MIYGFYTRCFCVVHVHVRTVTYNAAVVKCDNYFVTTTHDQLEVLEVWKKSKQKMLKISWTAKEVNKKSFKINEDKESPINTVQHRTTKCFRHAESGTNVKEDDEEI